MSIQESAKGWVQFLQGQARMATPEAMVQILKTSGRPLRSFKKGDTIHVHNKMVKDYSYRLQESPGTNFAPEFKPHFTPAEMLRLGVFEGKYLNDSLQEFPAEWFLDAIALDKLRPGKPEVAVNLFQTDSRQPLSVWRKNDWAPHKGGKGLGDPKFNPDERGWFQWYCRYWMGRRLPELDHVQIGRHNAFKRHAGQIKANCKPGDLTCRPRQRQGLLQWAYNPFI